MNSVCFGWQKLTPGPPSRDFVIREDRDFATQIAAHNAFGRQQGCWQ